MGRKAMIFAVLFSGCYGNFQSTDAGGDAVADSSGDVEQTPEDSGNDSDRDSVGRVDADDPVDALPDAAADADGLVDSGDADQTDADDDSCSPDCSEAQCGPNGCGGLCGPGCSTDELCREGQCLSFQLVSQSFTSCAVLDGTAFCWGNNGSGQVGDGSFTNRTVPIEITSLSDVKQISTSGDHTCAVVGEGDLWCWGENDEGQLGGGITDDVPAPQQFEMISDAQRVQCGYGSTCVLRSSDGTLRCWGSGVSGRLGNGSTDDQIAPVMVSGLVGIESFATWNGRSCAWNDEGTYCWGSNDFIDDSWDDKLYPESVSGLDGLGVQEMALAKDFTCALTGANEVVCWGRNQCGELGLGMFSYEVYTIDPVIGLGPSLSISASHSHSCALTEDHQGFCWGLNERGQLLGNEDMCVNLPLEIPGLYDLTGTMAGWQHSCVWNELGEIWCWGANPYGVLGVGDTEDRSEPTRVDLP